MMAVLTIAQLEFRLGLRNRWVAMAIILQGLLALSLAFLGSAPTGTLGVDRLTLTVVGLSSLSVYLLPMIALLLAHDAIVGEFDRGNLALLLTYPLSRARLITGKFLGHATILALGTTIGYGIAAAAVVVVQGGETSGIAGLARLIGSSILLGCAFLAIGYAISAFARASGTAAGIAVATWLVLVLLYDLGLLGALVLDQGQTLTSFFPYLLLANPADSYRLFNLTGLEGVEMLSGMGGVAAQLAVPAALPLAVLAAWIFLPLTLAALLFRRREP